MHCVQYRGDSYLAFPSPLLMRQLPDHADLNPPLAALLRDMRRENPEPSTSAIGGWQSTGNLVASDRPQVRELMTHIASAAYELSSIDLNHPVDETVATIGAEAWGNIMDNGDCTMIHNHHRADWSGVYYVDAERRSDETYGNGCLELVDPRTVQLLSGPGRFRRPFRHITIEPVNGLLVLFPSWMNHLVYSYRGPERISIAFNLKLNFLPEAEQPAAGQP